MVVKLNNEGTIVSDDGDSGFINLIDTDKDENYASWPFYTEDYNGSKIEPFWTWENPDEDVDNITLSPSLILQWEEPNTFHIHVRDGEVQHCSNCQCGCR